MSLEYYFATNMHCRLSFQKTVIAGEAFEHWVVDSRVEGSGLGWRAVSHACVDLCGKGLT